MAEEGTRIVLAVSVCARSGGQCVLFYFGLFSQSNSTTYCTDTNTNDLRLD